MTSSEPNLQERAKSKGIEVNRLVNDMLKREIDLIEDLSIGGRNCAGRDRCASFLGSIL